MCGMAESRELNLTLDFCLRIGEVLLSSGAGAADVTATMQALAWQLGVKNVEVDVTFTPDGDSTRVVLVHRHLERHGRGWETMRDGVDGECGWPLYLQRFVAVVAEDRLGA